MNGDLTLATIGVSAGVWFTLGAWAALWWRDRVPFGQRQLVRHCYVYVDDRIGATKTENIRRANRRHHLWRRLWFLPKNTRSSIANFFWPVPQIGTGTAALPSTKRMGRYVTLEFRGAPTAQSRGLLGWLLALFGVRLYQLWNIHAVVIRPTSETDVHVGGFEGSLARWVAWSLRLTGPDQLTIDAHPELGYWRLSRKAPPVEIPMTMPVGVNADA